jgi:membrane-associated phospholipid phosphatase
MNYKGITGLNGSRKKLAFLFLLFGFYCAGQNGDINLLKKINSSATTNGVNTFRFITNTEAYASIGTPITVLTIGFIKKDKVLQWKGYEIAVSSIATSLITTGLKFGVARDRPFVTYPNDITKYTKAGSHSFPSGHTSSAFANATALSLNFPKWYVIVPAYGYACTIAYSRMYLGVHYPTDVFAGALIGTGTAIGTHYLFKYIKKKRESNNFK